MNTAIMTTSATAVPNVDGVPIAAPDEALTAADLRIRAHLELLRQAAMRAGLLAADDPQPDHGAISEAAAAAIEALLDRELVRPPADEETCRRYHAGNSTRFSHGERVRLRHILFAVTPGVGLDALRKRAEACLIDLRSRTRTEGDRFIAAAAQLSNCPSGSEGGVLGWLAAGDCAPEFAREVFGRPEVGVLPRLVRSRFGFHVVEVLERDAGKVPRFEDVHEAVRQMLARQTYATALRQYLQVLAAESRIEGIHLDATASPLLQ